MRTKNYLFVFIFIIFNLEFAEPANKTWCCEKNMRLKEKLFQWLCVLSRKYCSSTSKLLTKHLHSLAKLLDSLYLPCT